MRFVSFIVAVFTFLLFFSITRHIARRTQLVSTFSMIIEVDLQTGVIGSAVQSKFPSVRPVVPRIESGIGTVASQALLLPLTAYLIRKHAGGLRVLWDRKIMMFAFVRSIANEFQSKIKGR